MEPKTRRRTAALGVALLFVSPPLFFRNCADHCPGGGVPIGGVEVTVVSPISVTYCTDGSTCTAGIGPLFAVLGVLLIGVTLVR